MKTLSVTINDDLYNVLKHSIPARKISKFVCEALADKLEQKNQTLYQAYLEASQDQDRESELQDWDHASLESWNEDPQSSQKIN